MLINIRLYLTVGLSSLLFAFLMSPTQSYAATYYVSPGGNDSNTCSQATNSSSPRRTISSALNCLAPGDTLVLRDGTYSGAPNILSNIPNGLPGQEVTIKAEHDGAVIITAGLQMDHTDSYIRVEGLRFHGSSSKTVLGNHIKFFRNEFKDGCSSGNCASMTVGTNDFSDTADILLEDNWFHGIGGRYNLLVYNADRVVVRRAVIRHDGGWTDNGSLNPEAGINFYNSSNCAAQNVIVIDSNESYATWEAAFYSVSNNSPPHGNSNNIWVGCIALVTKGQGLTLDGGNSINSPSIKDCVFWDNAAGGISLGTGPRNSVSIRNVTIGRTFVSNSGWGGGIGFFGSGSATIANAIIKNKIKALDGAAATYYDCFGNVECPAGAGRVTYDPEQNGLEYMPRIEDNSPLKSAGQSGGQIGATLVSRIGASGTLYGETGWDTITGTALWPWPYQERIKAEMCDTVTRGFCGAQSLTKYIWEYLGNPIPPEMNGGGDTSPPTVPAGLTAAAVSASQINLSWTASTDDTGVAGYRVDVSTDPAFGSFVPGYNSKDIGNLTEAAISGLASQTTYYARVKAYDAASNMSGNSTTASATTDASSPGCLTASYPASQWQNRAFTTQSGSFTAEADVTPSASNIDAGLSVSNGPQTAWDGLAATVLFYTDGKIKAINGAGYTAGTIPYVSNTSYHVRMVVNLATHTYSAYVRPAGGSEQVVGTDLAFRATQSSITSLGNWNVVADAGSITACNFTVTPSSGCLTATYPSAQWQNESFAPQSGIFTAEADVTPAAASIDAAWSVSNGPQTTWDGLAATVIFYTDNLIHAINGSSYTPGGIAYTPNQTYHLRMVIDLPRARYSVFVTPPGGSEQLLGSDLAFRTTQASVSTLSNWNLVADAGSITACNMTMALPEQIVFQQGLNGYSGVTDTWINLYDPDVNFNGETKLLVLGTEDIKSLVRFDLSSIPAGARITSATLSLYNYGHENSANGGAVNVHRASKVWVESQATWNVYSAGNSWAAAGMQAGSDYATSPMSSITINTAINVWRNFDVTGLVQGWVNGTTNNGFVVRSPAGGVKPRFYSSGYSVDASLRPKLSVNYTR
ncbi:MAG TPA: DNRLRE domain-containing protein [Blastocatellia bacterium]|nr:DNRLRE domain-containing protein [Blastocatellia bacterium]